VDRPADMKNVVHPLQLDGAVDGEVGARSARQRSGEADIDRDRAVL
jgi:hypothetical protein